MKRIFPGIAGIVIIVLVVAAPVGAETWVSEVIDSQNDVGIHSSIALDSEGNPHISYHYSTGADLMYASWNGTAWLRETVDSGSHTVGRFTSLALDSQEYPHISYYDSTSEDLKYASWNGTAWTCSLVDGGGNVGQDSSLALDSSGTPHISYLDFSSYDLKYASWNGSAWVTEVIDSDGSVGYDSSIALDPLGNSHISYQDYSNYDLKYASWNGTGWEIETVDSAGKVGEYSSLAIDSLGTPHISYYDSSNYCLKHASLDGEGWVSETVDTGGFIGLYTSIALDPSGDPRISYYDVSNHDLKCASRNGSEWTTVIVDWDNDVGWYTSIAVDSLGCSHISYYDASNHDLKYAREWTAPVAGFTASPLNGTVSLTVVFDDSSTQEPTEWSWSFGDGGASTEQNPTHTYTTPGMYDVTLTVSNPDGSDSLTKPGYITVLPDPISSYDIPLAAGWNMVSVPVTEPVLTVPDEMTDTVYGYDPVNRTYAEANLSALVPGVGYWVSATDACTLVVNGTDMDCYGADLSSGWNMIGSVCGNASFADCETIPADSVQNSLYGYSPAVGTYVTTTTLLPGAGYWASATQGCVLNVSV